MTVIFAFGSQAGNYNIIDYGAIRNDTTIVNTKAIQSAIDVCSQAGGGTVVIPAGEFLSGTILMKSNVELHFEHQATLLGSPNLEDYPVQPVPEYRSVGDKGGFRALIYAEGIENIALTGNGLIDGQGHRQHYNAKVNTRSSRSKNIMFISCKNVKIDGLRIQNSGFWAQHYLNCEDVVVNNIRVYNQCNYNNDAIDFDGCRRVILSNSTLDSVDDGIALKSTGIAPLEDVVITNCIISSFMNAIKTGTESVGGFRNITISNCVVKPSRFEGKNVYNAPAVGWTAVSLILVDGGIMEGININNLIVYGTRAPFYIRLTDRGISHIEGVPKPDIGKMRNISISNVMIYGTDNFGSSITGYKDVWIENVSLNNIQFFTAGLGEKTYKKEVPDDPQSYPQPIEWQRLPANGLFVRYVRGIDINNVTVGVEKPDDRPAFLFDNVSQLQVQGCRLVGWNEKTQPFVRVKALKDYKIEKPLGWTGKNKSFIVFDKK